MQRLIQRVGVDGLPGRLRPETLPLLHDHAHQDWRDVVARVDVPVLMVAGRQSQFWPCEHAEAAVQGTAARPGGRRRGERARGEFRPARRVQRSCSAFLGEL